MEATVVDIPAEREAIAEDLRWIAKANTDAKCLVLPLLASPVTVRLFHSEFHCARCGNCCQGRKDYPKDSGIALQAEEVLILATLKGLSKHQFKDRYTFSRNGRRLMYYPCCFYDNGCRIYKNRPVVCRLFPLGPPETHPSGGQELLLTVDSSCTATQEAICRVTANVRAAARFLQVMPADMKAKVAELADKLAFPPVLARQH